MSIQQLRAQIAALQDATMDENRNFRSAYDEGKFDALSAVDALLDSMQEEPVSKDKMTISKEWFEHCKKSWYNEGYIDGEYNRDRQFEETVSEDLGEYINELSKQFPEVSFAKLSRIAVRVAKWKEEQMIAKAIDAEVLENYDGKVIKYDDTILDEKLSGCKVFDKVKVIVIKED